MASRAAACSLAAGSSCWAEHSPPEPPPCTSGRKARPRRSRTRASSPPRTGWAWRSRSPSRATFLRLLAEPAFKVAPGEVTEIPVEIDTRDLTPGEYRGVLTIRCTTCGREPGCAQDRTLVPVHMTVVPQRGEIGRPENPMTPELTEALAFPSRAA